MNHKSVIAFAAGSIVTAALAVLMAVGPGHDHDKKQDMNQGMHQMDEAKMMAELARISTPATQHKELAKTVGTWTAKTSFILDPSQPPETGTGTMTVEPVLDGRFFKSHFKMEFMGQPFEGIGFIGYSVAHEQFVSTWMDTMSTTILYTTGNKDQNDKLVMQGIATSPMGDNPMKIVMTHIDNNHWSDEFYDQMPDGSWTKTGTIHYTRN